MIKALSVVQQPPCQTRAGRAAEMRERRGGQVPALGETRNNTHRKVTRMLKTAQEVKHAHEACAWMPRLTDGLVQGQVPNLSD